ncbi:hypothetical protein CI109_105031 [Kwoniella shandongensis]|uniref:Uncharacterized protein n=1 Tax=Kwoniella shandongensis TaxID=1734106 RepID=A0A5M6BYK7_9TREE|nr:uncharacterized protein CI109_004370 [Kwoniella shandongensis]KAA5527310.1 hypothetical protein CI109_004370 [Kwoniella shandongensis]
MSNNEDQSSDYTTHPEVPRPSSSSDGFRNTNSTPTSSSSTLMDLNGSSTSTGSGSGSGSNDEQRTFSGSGAIKVKDYEPTTKMSDDEIIPVSEAGPSRRNSIRVGEKGVNGDEDEGEGQEEKGTIVQQEEKQEVETIDGRPKDIYDRFTESQKKRILAVVAYSAIIAPMTSSVFFPSIPQMSADLHTSASVINYTVAVFIVTIGIAPVIWSPFAGFYGRRPIFLASMPIMVVASIGVALSKNVGALIGTRILQGIGSSCFLSVGAGCVGDIYRPTERGRAMATFYAGVLLGPAISPIIAGIFTEYTPATWRSTQYFLAGCGALSVVLTLFLLPETSHPPLPHTKLKEEQGKKFVWYWCNPFSSLGLVRWPNVAAACFISSAGMLDTYCFIVPLSSVFKDRYNIHNAAIAGCLFLVSGAGNILGSRIAGPWADRVVKQYMAKRGYRRPEDRLRAAFLGFGVLMPLSNLGYGWLLQAGKGGMAPPLVFLFINGVALMLALSPLNTYLIDANQTRSAEVIAANNCIRYLFAAAASAFILPLANAIGWGWTMTLCAGVVWIATIFLYLLYRYGDKWREAANVRYGITKKEADEERTDGGKDEEEAVRGESTISRVPSAEDVEHENEKVGEIQRNPSTRASNLTRARSSSRPTPLSRVSTRKGEEMPPVKEMLKRTVSLGGASVHGGG